jgi:hypothetical protein
MFGRAREDVQITTPKQASTAKGRNVYARGKSSRHGAPIFDRSTCLKTGLSPRLKMRIPKRKNQLIRGAILALNFAELIRVLLSRFPVTSGASEGDVQGI